MTDYKLEAIKHIYGSRYIVIEYDGDINDFASYSINLKKQEAGIGSLNFVRFPGTDNYLVDPFSTVGKWREPKVNQPWILCQFQLTVDVDFDKYVPDLSTATRRKMTLIKVDKIVLSNTPFNTIIRDIIP